MPITAIGLTATGWRLKQTFTQSTATTAQSISPHTAIALLGVGTASGFNLNRYSLASGPEGHQLMVLVTATGEAKLSLTGTATGTLVLNEKDDCVHLIHEQGTWYILSMTATVATAT